MAAITFQLTCVFGWFGWASLVAVHSPNCQFDYGIYRLIQMSDTKVRSVSQIQTALRIIGALLFLSHCEQTWHSFRKQLFLLDKCKKYPTRSSHIFNVSAISCSFTLWFAKIIWCTFFMFSRSSSFGRLNVKHYLLDFFTVKF